MILHIIFPALASLLLTPVIMKYWRKLSPVPTLSKYDKIGQEQLRKRNNKIDILFTILMFIGFMIPSLLYYFQIGPQNGWPLGLAFGFMIMLPVTVVSIITLREGTDRFNEFWRYYELKWGIGLKGIRLLYITTSVVGLISLFMILLDI